MKPFALLFACAIAASTASAQMQDLDGLPSFDRIDTNGDAVVTRDEAEKVRQMIFDRLDANGDGVISTNEVVARQQLMQMRSEVRQSRLALAAARLDANADGAVSVEEFDALPDLFALIDTDGDDTITADEAAQVRARLSVLRP